jgi:hypothetical protein
MVRPIAFMILYPLMCVLLFYAISIAMPGEGELLSIAGFGYALVFLPGLIIAAMDLALERIAHNYRLFWAGVAGFCLLPGLIYLFVPAQRLGQQEALLFGAVGALSAICCWLLSGWTRQKIQAR